MKNGIAIGNPDGENSISVLRLNRPIELLLKQPGGKEYLRKSIHETILPELKNGLIILNQNIPEQLLRAAGVKKDQHLKIPETQGKMAGRLKQKKI